MMTRELNVSILTAPLAAIDRRALSQAWYSALHVAHQDRTVALSSSHCAAVPPHVASRLRGGAVTNEKRACGSHLADSRRHIASVRGGDVRESIEPVRARSELSRRIEMRFRASAQPTARATFSLGRGAARIHVILQNDGSRTHLIAICRPEMREVVARALAQARLALRRRGLSMAVLASESGACT